MKSVEENIAAAMGVQKDITIVPIFTIIFQDFWELELHLKLC